jgi:RNA polymerase sigma-70 factor (ECF subfamily)
MIAGQETNTLPTPLAKLYLEQHDRLFRAAYRVVGNATDAEDVVQTVFLRLTLRDSDAPAADNVPGYLYRATINTALDLLRTRREGQVVSLELVEHRQDAQADTEQDHVLRTRLRDALARLNPRWAEMFVLKHIEGCDNGEIARLCSTSQAVVAVTLFRTRSRLKAELAAQVGVDP